MLTKLGMVCLLISFVSGYFAFAPGASKGEAESQAGVIFVVSFLAFTLFGLCGLIPPGEKQNPPVDSYP